MLRKKICAKLRTIIYELRYDEAYTWYWLWYFDTEEKGSEKVIKKIKKYAIRHYNRTNRKIEILIKILQLIDYRNV